MGEWAINIVSLRMYSVFKVKLLIASEPVPPLGGITGTPLLFVF